MNDPLLTYIRFATVLVRRDRLLHQKFRGVSGMAKFSAVADRMKAEQQADAKAADELMEKLNAHAARRPKVIQKGHDWIASQLQAEIEAMDAGLSQLSNAIDPTQESSKS